MATRTKIKLIPSNLPSLASAAVFVVFAFILPINTLWGLLVDLGLLGLSYFLFRKFKLFPDQKVSYEEEIPFEQLEVAEIIKEGQTYLDQLNQANQQITDPEVSKRITEIVSLSNNILDKVKEDPSQRGKIRKFISYYLPTLKKLLDYYASLEKQPLSMPNVEESKNKIAAMLKTVIQGFKQQLDSLYDKDALDISSDIKVMEALMQKEGFKSLEEK